MLLVKATGAMRQHHMQVVLKGVPLRPSILAYFLHILQAERDTSVMQDNTLTGFRLIHGGPNSISLLHLANGVS